MSASIAQTVALRDLDLTPRAVAVLVALRKGPRSTGSIADAIGDARVSDTADLMQLMADGIDGNRRGPRLVTPLAWLDAAGRKRWGLTYDGLGWLESHGVEVAAAAKAAIYAGSADTVAAEALS